MPLHFLAFHFPNPPRLLPPTRPRQFHGGASLPPPFVFFLDALFPTAAMKRRTRASPSQTPAEGVYSIPFHGGGVDFMDLYCVEGREMEIWGAGFWNVSG